MKNTVAFVAFVVLLFVGSSIASRFPKDRFFDVNTEEKLRNVEKKFGRYDPSPQAVNWTWSSWMAGGPTCLDKRNLTAVDIPDTIINPMTEEIDKIMESFETKYGNLFGYGLSVVYNGKTIANRYYGKISVNSTQKPDENTVISIASNTKLMTSLLMHYLAEQGALKLSDPVTKYFNEQRKPAFTVPNPYDSEAGANAVTLESMSSQSSGLTHEISCRAAPECNDEICVGLINELPLFRKPFTQPSYSNLGFALLGHCCERAARDFFKNESLAYEDLMKTKLFDPLEMTSTGFNYPDDVKARMATGYTYDYDDNLVEDPNFARPLNWYNPTGGAYSTTKDMTNFMKHLLARDVVLSPAGFEGYFLPGVDLSDGVSSYGRTGWEVFYANGFRTLTKDGLVGGFNSQLALVPELKLGIFCWVNLYSDMAYAFSAEVTNVVVPTILKYVEENQPKLDVPDVMDKIVGNYNVEGVTILSIQSNDQTAQTGVYVGFISDQKVWYVYDKKTTEAYQKDGTYFFRYFSMPTDDYDSCMLFTMSGVDDGLMIIQNTGEDWAAAVPDLLISATKS